MTPTLAATSTTPGNIRLGCRQPRIDGNDEVLCAKEEAKSVTDNDVVGANVSFSSHFMSCIIN